MIQVNLLCEGHEYHSSGDCVITIIEQTHKRLSTSHYQYEKIPNDFSAIITVDELGLVVDYPELFVRAALQESKYH